MGMLACNIRSMWYIRIYGVILLPAWVIVIVVGGSAVYMSTAGKDELMEDCYDVVLRFKETTTSATSPKPTSEPCGI